LTAFARDIKDRALLPRRHPFNPGWWGFIGAAAAGSGLALGLDIPFGPEGAKKASTPVRVRPLGDRHVRFSVS
jgi:hypothetical protein